MAKLPTPKEIQYMQQHLQDDRTIEIIVTGVAGGLMAYFAVALRLVSRRLKQLPLGLDDWTIIAGLLLFTGYIVSFSLSTVYGAGRHVILVTNARALVRTFIAVEVLYLSSLLAIKTSILFLYHRIFPQRSFTLALVGTGVFTFAWLLAFICTSIFRCIPISAQWDPTVKAQCIEYGTAALVAGIINVLTDFLILGLPIPLVWQLHISMNKKILISITFMAGGCACIVSVAALFYARQVNSSVDPSWDNIIRIILATFEVCVGFIAACIPAYRPLVKHLIKRKATSSAQSCDYPLQPRNSRYVRQQSDPGRFGISQIESKGQHSTFVEDDIEGGYL